MKKEDWIRKLTSRKFWLALAAFIAGLVAFIKSPSDSTEAITSLIMSFGAVVAYIIGEGLTDAASVQSNQVVTYATSGYIETENEKPPESECEAEIGNE